ncbi:hypothetical protein [Agrobacterium rosae]|uniref:SIR2-like domain-containing protein n=1 Tax=Agrobacterium rosae TaxID=1972867 RepID=A0AAE5RY51_9HYPH|nr:hypothetical protein [Agrobacterium rosae]KAA3511592.1 hypothetical protein DXM21_14195 [Agrobacterium rosae]KAA3518984.1 hypothetical protein DXM25_13820 [Agrobacterium rosae]MQB49288.1 hypothetical protein [Agrobacterium rosae]POO51806.1 hypothetical protein CPJ18_09965 [Agrobacterium rosae]
MFKDNTVFVVGAGASAEFGLPVGWDLLQTIKTNCNFEGKMWHLLREGPAAIFNHYRDIFGCNTPDENWDFQLRMIASAQILAGIESADSIDEYIFRYTHDPIIAEVGKLQITYAISLAEKSSTMGDSFERLPQSLDGTWIWAFTKALINGVRADQVDSIGQNITIICFNYDRCIEHYLEYALVRSFHDLTHAEARKIVAKINIIHPYGSLGDLEQFPFGQTFDFARMTGNIITWSESVRDPKMVEDMQTAIKSAEQIVFMGFAFATQNLKLMTPLPDKSVLSAYMTRKPPDVYATAFAIPKEVENSLKSKIIEMYMGQLNISAHQAIHFQYGAKCKEFFDIHRLNLVK